MVIAVIFHRGTPFAVCNDTPNLLAAHQNLLNRSRFDRRNFSPSPRAFVVSVRRHRLSVVVIRRYRLSVVVALHRCRLSVVVIRRRYHRLVVVIFLCPSVPFWWP